MSDHSEIVAKLRRHESVARAASVVNSAEWRADLYCAAADEIERLRKERDEARRERDTFRRALLAADLERCRLQREICEHRAATTQGKTAQDIAASLGWWCFDAFDTRGLHGDPRDKPVPQEFKRGSWVDRGTDA